LGHVLGEQGEESFYSEDFILLYLICIWCHVI
jgi:hypothetical protein